MRFGWLAAAAAMVCAVPASATTLVRYELIGVGTETTSIFSPTPSVGQPITKDIFLSFVIDADQGSTYSYSAILPGQGQYSIMATGSPTTLAASGSRNPDNRYRDQFSANVTLAGVAPDGGFARSVTSSAASGTLTILANYSSGFGTVGATSYSASISRINVSIVSEFAPYQFSAVPEHASWAMMILGAGVIGAVARRRRVLVNSKAVRLLVAA